MLNLILILKPFENVSKPLKTLENYGKTFAEPFVQPCKVFEEFWKLLKPFENFWKPLKTLENFGRFNAEPFIELFTKI